MSLHRDKLSSPSTLHWLLLWWHVRRAAYELHDSERSGVELDAFGVSDEMIMRAHWRSAIRFPCPSPRSTHLPRFVWSVTTSMGFEPPIPPTTAAEQLYTVWLSSSLASSSPRSSSAVPRALYGEHGRDLVPAQARTEATRAVYSPAS